MYEVLEKEMIMGEKKPFQSCHASTLEQLPNGDVVAAWFAGTAEGNQDVDVWWSRKTNGLWAEPTVLTGDSSIPHWNPVLYYADDGRLILYYKQGHTIPHWFTCIIESLDGGKTWSKPAELVPGDIGGRGPVRNKPIRRQDGVWLAPASIEDEYWDAFVDISLDQGITWTMSGYVPMNSSSPRQTANFPAGWVSKERKEPLVQGKGLIQPTLWESSPNHIHMLLRSTEGWIYRSDSTDGGSTWGPAYKTGLPNNNSGIDLARLDNKKLALVYNPVPGNWAERTPLIVSISNDNGTTWGEQLVLEAEPGEYSYPAIISRGNEILLTYTWNRVNIAYWRIRISF